MSQDFNEFQGKTAEFLKKKGETLSKDNPITQLSSKMKDAATLKKLKDYGGDQWGWGWFFSILGAWTLRGGLSTLALAELLGGVALLYLGKTRKNAGKRMTDYFNIIGKSAQYEVGSLSSITHVALPQIRKDLQTMITMGVYPSGFLDRNHDILVLKGVEEYAQKLQEAAAPPRLEDLDNLELSEENRILQEIRHISQGIDHPEISQKIEKIGFITGKIFEVQRDNPHKSGELHSFLSYYLPTTLKIIRTYQQLEEQEVDGVNIRSSMEKIHLILGKVEEGFQKQLDQLFQEEAMDVASDIKVLEQMMARDGLSPEGQIRLQR